MGEDSLYLYDAYQDFYEMSKNSDIFSRYCNRVFGSDFSQDGFSDIAQIDDLILKSGIGRNSVVLDIGCGNGSMCEYVHNKTGATVYGFDYSSSAIESAKRKSGVKEGKLFFDVGIIGQKKYNPDSFDVILSVDTMYFATDLTAFVSQIFDWLRPQGAFATYYSELRFSDETPVEQLQKDNTKLALALRQLKLPYEAIDYTANHFEHMKHKRAVALEMRDEFLQNGLEQYSKNAIGQSVDINMSYDDFIKFSTRYMYIVKRANA